MLIEPLSRCNAISPLESVPFTKTLWHMRTCGGSEVPLVISVEGGVAVEAAAVLVVVTHAEVLHPETWGELLAGVEDVSEDLVLDTSRIATEHTPEGVVFAREDAPVGHGLGNDAAHCRAVQQRCHRVHRQRRHQHEKRHRHAQHAPHWRDWLKPCVPVY